MKKLVLLFCCMCAIGVSVFAMEFGGEKEPLLGDQGKKTGRKKEARLVPWNEMPVTRIARTGKLKKLIEALRLRPNASINAKTISGLPPIHILVVACDWKELKKFIEEYKSEIDFGSKDDEEKTVLFKFLLGSSDDQVCGFQYFVHKLNADLRAKDTFGNTLIHEAAMRNNSRMMGELLSACNKKLGMKTFAKLLAEKNKKGDTALDVAIEKGKELNDDKVLQKLRIAIQEIAKQVGDRKKEMEEQKSKIDKSVRAIKRAEKEILGLVGKMTNLSFGRDDEDSEGDEYYDPIGDQLPQDEDGSLLLLSFL